MFAVTLARSYVLGPHVLNDVLSINIPDYYAYGVATYRGIGKRAVA